MAKTYGVDVSHWEGKIDWAKASKYFNFCLVKATEGIDFVDGEFIHNKDGLITNNVPWGAYHFFHPSQNPIQQADHFVSAVGDGCSVYIADIETAFFQAAGEGADVDVMLGGIVGVTKTFLDRVEVLTKRKPVIYTSPGFWNYSMYPNPDWASEYDLWVAHWGVSEPRLPNGWDEYVMHQYGDAGDIPGIPGKVDEDWFNGSIEDVHAFFDFFPIPPQQKLVQITADYLNMRASPYGVKVGMLRKGNVLLVTKTAQDSDGKDWYFSGDLGCFASWWSKPYP